MTSEESQSTHEYFYGKEASEPTVHVNPDLLVVPEDPRDIKAKIVEIQKELEEAQLNKEKKDLNEKKFPEFKIPEEAMLSEMKNSDQIVDTLQQQQFTLQKLLKEKTPPKKSLGSVLRSFFS